jgi:spore coat protein A
MLTPTMTRRRLLQYGAVAAGAMMVPWYLRGDSRAAAAIPGGTLNPTSVPKYASPLVVPGTMPKAAVLPGGVDYYEIALRQFKQQMLPTGLPSTMVYGYGPLQDATRFATPALTIEAKYGVPVRARWVNGLVDAKGGFLPPLLPVDPTLHWANPPGGPTGRDMRPTFRKTPGPYTGPVPIVTHLHGAHAFEESDGYPEAWYLPAARNIPVGYATEGTWHARFKAAAKARFGADWPAGSAVFQYKNDQPATTLWYHDHTLGMTRANVYAGTAGFYLIRGGAQDTPPGVLPSGANEILLVIQDRSFNKDGSLFYPDSRVFFDGYAGPYIPGSDVPPIWNPEFFGNAMLVNGRTWPSLDVRPQRYRFRILNACGSRMVILKLASVTFAKGTTTPAGWPASARLQFLRIGGDGGFLPKPVAQDEMLLAPAERADVIVDFSGLPAGTEVFLVNEGPDEPFGGGRAPADFAFADPATTGQVMRFRVGAASVAAGAAGTSAPLDGLALPTVAAPAAAVRTRKVSLNELASAVTDGPAEARLGTLDPDGTGNPLMWMEKPTETPALNAPEIWEIYNFTEDAHPIHLHQTQFAVHNREFAGQVSGPDPGETGAKDTVIVYPGDAANGIPGITRLKAQFDIAGRYVWHCHILEHEDNEMMRPMQVGG